MYKARLHNRGAIARRLARPGALIALLAAVTLGSSCTSTRIITEPYTGNRKNLTLILLAEGEPEVVQRGSRGQDVLFYEWCWYALRTQCRAPIYLLLDDMVFAEAKSRGITTLQVWRPHIYNGKPLLTHFDVPAASRPAFMDLAEDLGATHIVSIRLDEWREEQHYGQIVNPNLWGGITYTHTGPVYDRSIKASVNIFSVEDRELIWKGTFQHEAVTAIADYRPQNMSGFIIDNLLRAEQQRHEVREDATGRAFELNLESRPLDYVYYPPGVIGMGEGEIYRVHAQARRITRINQGQVELELVVINPAFNGGPIEIHQATFGRNRRTPVLQAQMQNTYAPVNLKPGWSYPVVPHGSHVSIPLVFDIPQGQVNRADLLADWEVVLPRGSQPMTVEIKNIPIP